MESEVTLKTYARSFNIPCIYFYTDLPPLVKKKPYSSTICLLIRVIEVDNLINGPAGPFFTVTLGVMQTGAELNMAGYRKVGVDTESAVVRGPFNVLPTQARVCPHIAIFTGYRDTKAITPKEARIQSYTQ